MKPETPKGIAESILGGASSSDDAAEDEDSETTALGMAADELLAAIETKDRTGVIDALRSLVSLVREG